LDAVERSGLVAKERLNEVLCVLERDVGAEATHDTLKISAHLTQVGLLTTWQSRQLLEGRSRGFFVGKYKLLNHLGSGGMSSVYLAEHLVMRRRVAIKILPTHRVADSSYLGRFHREARAAAALDHPNIVRAFDVDHEGDVHYLVMEYVEGSDLRELVETGGPLDFRTAADYIRQASDGLAHAHEAGLIHRDLKPANLLVDRKGVVKVLDLGLARFADDAEASLTREFDEKVLGTVDYMSPEQAIDSHRTDGRADIYSLGCTLYFALTGHPPFPEGTLAQRLMAHQTQEPVDLRAKLPDMPAELAAICRRMMAKSPSARHPSAAAARDALAAWLRADRERSAGNASAGNASAGSASAGSAPLGATDQDETWTLAPLDDESPAVVSRRQPDAAAAPQSAAAKPPAKRSGASAPDETLNSNQQLEIPLEKPEALWGDLLSALPPGDLTATTGRSTTGIGRPLPGRSLHKLGAKPSSKPAASWDSPWLAIAIGSLLGAAAAGGWLVFRIMAG
jgi:serine/threonine protein kinase